MTYKRLTFHGTHKEEEQDNNRNVKKEEAELLPFSSFTSTGHVTARRISSYDCFNQCVVDLMIAYKQLYHKLDTHG